MIRTIPMTFGDRTYEVPMAPIKRAKAWRKQLRQPLDELLGLISTDLLNVELSSLQDLVATVNKVLPVLLEATDTLLGLLYAYAPTLKADREFIEEQGYDDQIVDAFLAVLKVAFPLGRLAALLGPEKSETSKSLPAPSGD